MIHCFAISNTMGFSCFGGDFFVKGSNHVRLQGGLTAPTSGGIPVSVSSLLELWVNVNTFQEIVDPADPNCHFSTRNGILIRCRLSLSTQHLKSIKFGEQDRMRILSKMSVAVGNGWRIQFCVVTHETDGLVSKKCCIQICCFPACSCGT